MMMKATFVAFVLALALGFASAAEQDVVVLTDANFESTVFSEDLILVEFYAPWCGHCKKLAPAYDEAAGILLKNDPPIKIAKMDATVETKTPGKYGVTGYPTLKVFRKGQATDYKGGRDVQSIVSYMKKNSGPSAKPLTTEEEVKKFISNPSDINIVGVFPTKNAEAEVFLKAADTLREEFRFGYITDKSVADALGMEGVVVYRSEKDKTVFPKIGELVDWIYDHAVSVPGEITKDNLKRFTRKNLPILKLYTDVDWKSNIKQTNYFLNRLKKIAEDTFAGKLLFAIADKTGFADEAAKFGLTSFPAVAIDDHTNSEKYRHQGEFSVANVVQFAKDFLAGKLKGYIKSEPTPTQTGPVTIVTGETFKEVVLDDSKDVLVEMYAPWCGHCKSLVPIYDELATSLKDESNLVIAKVDATANDVPHGKYQAKGYPTIFFSPAGKKDSPIKYEGARDVKSFTEFLKKNSVNSFKGNKSEL